MCTVWLLPSYHGHRYSSTDAGGLRSGGCMWPSMKGSPASSITSVPPPVACLEVLSGEAGRRGGLRAPNRQDDVVQHLAHRLAKRVRSLQRVSRVLGIGRQRQDPARLALLGRN